MSSARSLAIAVVFLAGVPFAIAGPVHAQADPATPVPLEARPFFFALSVPDAEASAAWYRRVFGFETARATDLEERGIRVRILRRDEALLELVELSDARPASEVDPALEGRYQIHGVFKIGFEVPDLDRALERLEALDVALRGDVVTEPDGSFRSAQIEDPDGNVVQLFERLD